MQSQPKPLTLTERLQDAINKKDYQLAKSILRDKEKGIDENDILDVNNTWLIYPSNERATCFLHALGSACDLETVNLFIKRGVNVGLSDTETSSGFNTILVVAIRNLKQSIDKKSSPSEIEEKKQIILALSAAGADPLLVKAGTSAHSTLSNPDFKLPDKEFLLAELKANDIKFKFGGKHFSTKHLPAMVTTYGKDFVKQQLIERLKENKELESCEFDEKDIEGIIDAKEIVPLLARPQLKSLKLTAHSLDVSVFINLPRLQKIEINKDGNTLIPVLEKNDLLTEVKCADKNPIVDAMLESNREGLNHTRSSWAGAALMILIERARSAGPEVEGMGKPNVVTSLFHSDVKNKKDETKIDFTSIKTLMGLSAPPHTLQKY